MTKNQKTILAVLSLFACVLIGAAGYIVLDEYQAFASKPLGPALPVAQQTLPPLWTATPGDPSAGMVTLAPTISFATNTPAPLCGGPSTMTILAIGQDQRSNNYQYGLGDIVRVVRVDFAHTESHGAGIPARPVGGNPLYL